MKFLLPSICIGAILVLNIINIPAMIQLVAFAIEHFPA